MLKVYQVMANSDRIEGRGKTIPVMTLTSKETAETVAREPEFCAEFGVMGKGPLKVQEIEVAESLREAFAALDAAIAKRVGK